jgi:hypothetical protein
VFISLGTLITGELGVGATIVLWCLSHELAWVVGLASGVAFCLSYLSMRGILPRVFDARPTIQELPPIEAPG